MKHEKRCYCDIILDSISEGIFTVDLELRITSINRVAQKLMGISNTETIGLFLEEALKMEKCPIARLIRKTVKTGKNVVNSRIKLQKSMKKTIPVSLNTVLLRDDHGITVGAAATFRDLSAIEELRRNIAENNTFNDIISNNREMHRLFSILPDIAKSDSNVLIEGPSGSGKELFARAIHNLSFRNKHKLVVINCSALPDTLLESELFGYVKGAFTDAQTDKPGRFSLAEKGTILLDEIGDISPLLQVKLLRVLQEKEYDPLGSTRTVKADVRVVSATNKNLLDLVARGQFREDLYFRLNVVRLSLPSLASRSEDIPLLVEHFISHFNALKGKEIESIADEALDRLMNYEFPGNVRELENIIEHAFILCHGHEIKTEHFPEPLRHSFSVPGHATIYGPGGSLKSIEESAIRDALQRNAGHRGKTAAELDIDKSSLWRKMRKYGLS